MLPQLKEAKVVDAGGMGLLILFKGMYEVLEMTLNRILILKFQKKVKNLWKLQVKVHNESADIKFGYCTEFMILSDKVNPEFKENLKELREIQ